MTTAAPSQTLASRMHAYLAGNRDRARLVFLAVLAIVVVGMSLRYLAKIEKAGDNGLYNRSAFLRWRAMIHEMFDGTNIYIGVHEYPNPPIMAIILKPFMDLPPVVGALTWFYAKVLMAVLSAIWIFRLVDPSPGLRSPIASRGSPMPEIAKGLAILLALPPILGDLSHNNVNIFILFLVAGCLEAYRRGWDLVSGLVLALAIACKVTPLMFVAFFIYKRAGKVVAGCAVGLALWLAIVPGALFGWQHNGELLESWYSLMVKPAIVDNRVTSEHPNQSIPGVVFRLFTQSPSFIAYPNNIPTPAAFHNIADIGTGTAHRVVKCLLAAYAGLIVLSCRSRNPERQGWRFAAECSLIVIGMLLFSERTWKHHAVILFLPLAVLVERCFASRNRWGLGLVLALSAALMAVTSMLSSRAADLAMVYGSYTLAFLVLAGGIAGILLPHRIRELRLRAGDEEREGKTEKTEARRLDEPANPD